MRFAEHATAALRGLFPVDDDPRVAWLPDQPAAAEAHLRDGQRADLVVGYPGSRLAELDEFVRRCLEHAGGSGSSDQRPAWNRLLDAVGHEALDAGAQLAHQRDELQIYLRGGYDRDAACAALGAAGVPVSPLAIGNALALLELETAEMIGLELAGEAVRGAVYLTLRNGSADDAAVIDELVGFLISALLRSDEPAAAWRSVAPAYLRSASEDWVYVSYEPTDEPGWVKVDVGQRPLALASELGQRLGADVAPMVATAGQRGFDPVAHVGLRFGAGAPVPTIYCSLV